jgi:PKD repeat protein
MKRIYTFIAALSLGYCLNAQDAFWTPTNYRGAFPVTDGTPATDWTSGWSNFNPDTINYSTNYTSTVSTDITSNVTWSGVILLQNKVYVKNNATLTIAPGTIIRGDFNTQGTLIITRGAKINAQGTASQPIVFTSNQAAGNRGEGDWGGVVILGLARNNQPAGVANIEGIVATTDTQYGGAFDNDNSGTIKYVRIEFAGIALEPNKEINGITFGSVGSATTVDYVQVSYSGDDSFEWFGGTVNCKHLIAYRGLDDDFDTDFGYRGKIQFALSIRDQLLSDAPGDSNSFESDNDAAGSNAQPLTSPIFSNITLVGPKGNGSPLPTGEKFEKAFRLRRNTATSVFNSLVTGWEKGLSIEGAPVVDNLNGDTMVFANNILTNFATPTWEINNTNTVVNSGGATSTWYQSWWSVDGNDSTSTLAQVNWVNIFAPLGSTPDARLASGSIASAGASFTNPKFFSVVAPTVATNSFTYCQGATATQLSATASNGNTLAWYDVATGGTALTGTPTPSTTASGTYTYYVSQKNTNGDESPRVAITVTVNALPTTPTISASGATSFCTGGNVVLTSSSATGNVWSTIATTQAITVTTSGSYSVTVTDNNGCSASSIATTVNVSNAPIPTVTASATQACSGDVVTLTASNSDSYSWSNSATTQSIQVTNTGSYTVTTTNADACDGAGASDAVTVTFTPTPTAAGSFTTNGNIVTFTNASTGASSYSWDFGDFTNSSATSPVHAYAVNNSYQVVLTAINGICSDTATFNVSITLSVEEIMGISNLVIYPNPASNDVFISFDNQSGNAMSIELVDQLGRVVYSSSEIQIIGFNTIALNSSNVSDGMYSVRLQSGNNSITKRIIIRK